MSNIQQQLQMLLQQQKALNIAVNQCAAAIESQGESTKADLNSLISGAMINEIPLQDHTIATMPDHFREQYVALLIHALKTATPLLSEAQYTLLGLLLRSMKLPQKNSAYFENSQEINSDFLLSFKKENTSDSAASFMMDLMLIARIPGNFSAQSLQLFSQLSELLGLTAKQLREIDEWCAYLLGLSDKVSLKKEEVKEEVKKLCTFLEIIELALEEEFGLQEEFSLLVTKINTGLIINSETPLIKVDCSPLILNIFKDNLYFIENIKQKCYSDNLFLLSYPGYFYSNFKKGDLIKGDLLKEQKNEAVLKEISNLMDDVYREEKDDMLKEISDYLKKSKSKNILLGYYYPLPRFALFWFSFIDFDALIQGQ
ncbi:hypothetical protein WMO13_08585 [Ignatzschineria larvae DSM 13226]|uniref:Uncharacterized protein n=1 Tax=Ignatzschineria larvae DSM 13226 TaxID=1111732 RepID=A0ABZ3BY23_9GAMM|nr:hypothetical protein [Ignatzschineria larvae]